jgi:hypothetical protein
VAIKDENVKKRIAELSSDLVSPEAATPEGLRKHQSRSRPLGQGDQGRWRHRRIIPAVARPPPVAVPIKPRPV